MTEAVPAPPSPLQQPMVYLSVKQAPVIASKLPSLRHHALPCWVPQAEIAAALGHSTAGIDHALSAAGTNGRPYLWASEFENVHTLWRYAEPGIDIDGRRYDCSESYLHAQKPQPYSDAAWHPIRESVMERGVRAKIAADPALATLLLATGDHPLLSLKGDTTWGFDPRRGGRNLLAEIWMRIRREMQAATVPEVPEVPEVPQPAADPTQQ